MPASDRVAVVDTSSWKVVTNLDAGPHPASVALQPDGKYMWVSYGADGSGDNNSGVAAIDCRTLEVAARIPTGRGPHAIALSGDSRFAFITNTDDGTVSIIDAAKLEKVNSLKVGDRPAAIAFSEAANTAYISNAGDGSIVAVSGAGAKVVARMQAEPGAGQIKFARGGRFGFVPNPTKNLVHILDAATNRIIQTADIDKGPEQITFSDTIAYVRRRESEIVLMIPLDAIGKEGSDVPVADFPGGEAPFGRVSGRTDTIVQAPGENAVLVANPADKAIYYYKEGMAAPMGSFSNYSREPRAVLVIDRSLREQSPGAYQTVAQLRQSGNYDVVFFLNTPRVVHCFDVSIATDFDLRAEEKAGRIIVQHLVKDRGVKVDETVRLQFRLIDEKTRQPRSDLRDVSVLTYLAPGIWQKRQVAEQVGEGTYEVRFIPPKPGFYYVFIESIKAGLRLNNSQFLILEAKGSS
jgi:YVTN family beta-propeller protein